MLDSRLSDHGLSSRPLVTYAGSPSVQAIPLGLGYIDASNEAVKTRDFTEHDGVFIEGSVTRMYPSLSGASIWQTGQFPVYPPIPAGYTGFQYATPFPSNLDEILAVRDIRARNKWHPHFVSSYIRLKIQITPSTNLSLIHI